MQVRFARQMGMKNKKGRNNIWFVDKTTISEKLSIGNAMYANQHKNPSNANEMYFLPTIEKKCGIRCTH